MTLPAPNLDDRRFQDLVDDAKRLVQQQCPEWTDHNVSDPGVTLIEAFAQMVDQLLYRLNRVPDRLYVKFLDLLGVRLFPPTTARADVTFWLSAPQMEPVRIPAGTEVATVRTETEEAISFAVTDDLAIVPCALERVATANGDGSVRDQTERLRDAQPFPSFGTTPAPDDVLLIGLSAAVPACAVLLHFECETEGVGVDPRNPPWIWEAWDGDGWVRCSLDSDGTGGFNRGGDIVLHVPRTHTASVIGRHRAGWIRCRVLEAHEGQPTYGASPRIHSATASTIGGTTAAVHGEIVTDEIIGASEGVPGQTFNLRRRPVVAMGGALRLHISGDEGWEEWTPVENFALSGPEDKHFLIEEMSGQIEFGPAVREPDGGLRQYGAVPPKGSELRVPSYRIGGGHAGNVARGALSVLKSSIPYVSRVENRSAAAGGVDGEDIGNAKLRGPILLRTRDRCVTVEDYEREAREAAPEVVRVQCVPAGQGADAGAVRVLVVPSAPEDELGRIVFDKLLPEENTLERIAAYLDERRVIGTRVMVEPPAYQGMTIVASLQVRSQANAYRVQTDALRALYTQFHPVRGGMDGRGWPFGRPVHVGEVYSVLQRLPGVELVEDVRLFLADPITGTRGDVAQRLNIDTHTLVFSYEHQVRVEGT